MNSSIAGFRTQSNRCGRQAYTWLVHQPRNIWRLAADNRDMRRIQRDLKRMALTVNKRWQVSGDQWLLRMEADLWRLAERLEQLSRGNPASKTVSGEIITSTSVAP
jgi:hypothetical protein